MSKRRNNTIWKPSPMMTGLPPHLQTAMDFYAALEKLSTLECLLTYTAAVAFYQGELLKTALKNVAGQLSAALTEFAIANRKMGYDLYTHDPDGIIPLVAGMINGIEYISNNQDNGEYLRSIVGGSPSEMLRRVAAFKKTVNLGGPTKDEGIIWLVEHAPKEKQVRGLTWNGIADHYYRQFENDPPLPNTVEHAAWLWLKNLSSIKKRGDALKQACYRQEGKT